MKLSDRQVAFLHAMRDGRERNPGQIFCEACPDEPYKGRRDAGATRTLDGMEKLGLVAGAYRYYGTGRVWRITKAGKGELAERGLDTRTKPKVGLAQGINGVPDRPGYVYGLAVRRGEIVEAEIYKTESGKPSVGIGTASGVGWAGPDGLHAQAQKLVDEEGE